jgi:hypothetical protein
MNEPKLGELIVGDVGRDAIHIAIAPVIANTNLDPGEHIGFVPGDKEKVTSTCDTKIGVVDPFLKQKVVKGQRFYIFLYPKTITSLRHEWVHPAFDALQAGKDESEAWLRRYAMKHNIYTVEEDGENAAFEQLMEDLKCGDLLFRGTDLHGLWELDDADNLRHHAERYLGIRIVWENFTFSCTC